MNHSLVYTNIYYGKGHQPQSNNFQNEKFNIHSTKYSQSMVYQKIVQNVTVTSKKCILS